MKSVNFTFLGEYDRNFDRIGASAEGLLAAEPDLCLLQLRKLAELFATGLATHKKVPFDSDEKLFDLIKDLRNRRLLPMSICDTLHEIRIRANEATHITYGDSWDVSRFGTAAEKCLRLAHRVAVWFHRELRANTFQSTYQPPGGEAPDRTEPPGCRDFEELCSLLDGAEVAIDRERNEEEGRALLERVEVALQRAGDGFAAWEGSYCSLRLDSIELARRNHRGLQPQLEGVPAEVIERSRQLLATGLPDVLDEVTMFHNRWAVSQLNAFRFESAHDQLHGFVTARREALESGYGLLGELEVQNHGLGALLGTLGQAQAFLASYLHDPSFIDEAIETFTEAEARFATKPDKARQDTYRAHAILERVRLSPGQALSNLERNTLDSTLVRCEPSIQSVLADPFPANNWHQLFRVALALKASLVLKQEVRWAKDLALRLNQVLEKKLEDPKWRPHNPYEQIAGCLVLLLPQCPRRVRTLLDRLSAQDSLSGFIASIYRLEERFRSKHMEKAQVQEFIDQFASRSGWPSCWADLGLNDRLRSNCTPGGPGPLATLPFNYS